MQEIEFSRWLFEGRPRQGKNVLPDGLNWLCYFAGSSKSHRENSISCIFLESPHQVDMKNVVKCHKHFFGYFNALKTHCDYSSTTSYHTQVVDNFVDFFVRFLQRIWTTITVCIITISPVTFQLYPILIILKEFAMLIMIYCKHGILRTELFGLIPRLLFPFFCEPKAT